MDEGQISPQNMKGKDLTSPRKRKIEQIFSVKGNSENDIPQSEAKVNEREVSNDSYAVICIADNGDNIALFQTDMR